jgi:hypothetical protein
MDGSAADDELAVARGIACGFAQTQLGWGGAMHLGYWPRYLDDPNPRLSLGDKERKV